MQKIYTLGRLRRILWIYPFVYEINSRLKSLNISHVWLFFGSIFHFACKFKTYIGFLVLSLSIHFSVKDRIDIRTRKRENSFHDVQQKIKNNCQYTLATRLLELKLVMKWCCASITKHVWVLKLFDTSILLLVFFVYLEAARE